MMPPRAIALLTRLYNDRHRDQCKSPRGIIMLLLLASLALGNPPADDWKGHEGAHLRNIKQVTKDFVRAGEGYFSPDGTQIVFQAEEKDTGNPFYQIFIMD